MKRQLLIPVLILFSFLTNAGTAQTSWSNIDTNGFFTRDSVTRQGYTLIFIVKDSSFSKETGQRMMDAYFAVYPKEVERFNRHAAKKVVFVIDPQYKGVAATAAGIVRFNPKWMHDHPEDIDVVTHEVMHIVQDYGNTTGPGWLTEGIADYARYKFGVNNDKGNWSLTPFKETQSYSNSYRITARFLVWLEKYTNKPVVDQLDAAMRSNTYTIATWPELTGKTIDMLWQEYAKDPAL